MEFTQEEQVLVKHLGLVFETTCCSKYYQLYGQDVETLTSWISASYQGRLIDYESIKKMEWSDTILLNDIGILYLSMEDLTCFEQAVLVQCNASKIMAFMWALCTERVDTFSFISKLIAFGNKNQVNSPPPISQECLKDHFKFFVGKFRTEFKWSFSKIQSKCDNRTPDIRKILISGRKQLFYKFRYLNLDIE
jgi:hypothetical protein